MSRAEFERPVRFLLAREPSEQGGLSNAVVVVPYWSRYWTAMLHALPVVDTCHINFQRGLLRQGSQVPREYRNFKYILRAYKVVYDGTPL